MWFLSRFFYVYSSKYTTKYTNTTHYTANSCSEPFVSRWCTIPTLSTSSLRVTTAGVCGSRASKRVGLYSVLLCSTAESSRVDVLSCCRDALFSHFKTTETGFHTFQQSPQQPPLFPPTLCQYVTCHLSRGGRTGGTRPGDLTRSF